MNETKIYKKTLSRREPGRLGLTGIAAIAASALIPETASAHARNGAPPQQKPMAPMAKMPKHDMTGYGIPDGPPQQIAMLIYPQMTALDLIGPLQMLPAMGNVEVHLIWKNKTKPVVSDAGVPITATKTFKECPRNPMILFVPGGSRGTLAVMKDRETLDFLRAYGKTAKCVTSVCTGSLILGPAERLQSDLALVAPR